DSATAASLTTEKTPIRRLADGATESARPRSQTTVWGMMIAILVAAAGLSLWTRRSGSGHHWGLPTSVFQVVGRSTVGTHPVFLVRLGERLLLVSSSTNGLQSLTEINDPAEVATLTAECLSRRRVNVAAIQSSNGPAGREPARSRAAVPMAEGIGRTTV